MIAIDLGSNTLRVTKLECTSGRFVANFEKVVKTADMLECTGVIHHESVDRIIYALQEVQKQIDFSAGKIVAVTTEALRRAKNSQEVLLRIKRETGVSFSVISGEEEAVLTLLAVKHRLAKLHFASKTFVLVDMGGGSTELIFSYADKVISRSFPVGIVTFAQSYSNLESLSVALSDKMSDIGRFCMETYAENGKVDSFIATAGTPTTVVAMKLGQSYSCYDPKKINGTALQKEELDFYLRKLLAMSFLEREVSVGAGRSDLIAAGILMYKEIFNLLEFNICVVIDDGLREGVALEWCHQMIQE